MNSIFIVICILAVIYAGYIDAFKLLHFSITVDDDKPSRCSLPPETGPCRAYIEIYFYNSSSDECETFGYGGCQGNRNRFWTEHDCEVVCKGKEDEFSSSLLESMEALIDEDKDACEYPPETGPCRAGFRNYYFNGEKCAEFVYGGCGGNPNNFRTKEECIERCILNNESQTTELECFTTPVTVACDVSEWICGTAQGMKLFSYPNRKGKKGEENEI